MVKKALLVGINYYSVSGCRLNGCINDIVNMKNTLIANYGYTENDIIMLRDDSTAYRQPTAQNIVGWLNALVAISSQCEEIWFHYSGHGSQIRDTNSDEKTGYDSVIVPLDFQSVGVVTDDLIFSLVKNAKCRTMLLFDSCNSGSVCDLKWSYEYKSENNYTRSQINNFAVSNPNIFCFSGCKDNQTSADIYDTVDKQYEGAFTDCFVNALKNNNYSAPLLKIYKDTCVLLASRGYTQKSLLSSTAPSITYVVQKSKMVSSLLLGSKGGFPESAVLPEKRGVATKTVSKADKKMKLLFA